MGAAILNTAILDTTIMEWGNYSLLNMYHPDTTALIVTRYAYI